MEPLQTWRIVTPLVVVPLILAYCLVRRRPDLLITALCIVAMTLYGMVQDQVSVRLSCEYFTIGHPPIEGLHDPTLLGLAWGFLGSWWGGLLLGMALGLTATLGKKPGLTVGEVFPGVACLLLAMAIVTGITGGSAYYNGNIVHLRLGGSLGMAIPGDRHLLFFTVACAHFGTYVTAIAGSLLLCGWAAWLRARKARGLADRLL
jgi:hypothetical protein